ncbi:hypothetical protein pipiens_003404 [Culex pipiens pipiens]|uniref:Uncharacterized protein n=1 Tax=Culex pipiens pipiens TaxID=38569 RepID=A0ABD1CYT5_CULPP
MDKEECRKSSLCRRELIEIIRDSKETPGKFTKASPPVAHDFGLRQRRSRAAVHHDRCRPNAYDLCGGCFGKACDLAWWSSRWSIDGPAVTTGRILQQHDAHTQRKEQRLAVTNRTQQYPNLYSTSNIRICQLAEEMVERKGPRKAAALKLKRSKSKEEIIPRTAKLDNVLAADLLLDILKITEDIADLMPHQLGDQKEHPDAPHDRTANGSLREAVTHIRDIFAYDNSRYQDEDSDDRAM